jgi:hypothetical protein
VHVCTLEAVGEDLPKVIPTLDDVSWQMVLSCSGGISQVDWELLDNKEIIICSTRIACEAVVPQPNTGVGFAIILGDVLQC